MVVFRMWKTLMTVVLGTGVATYHYYPKLLSIVSTDSNENAIKPQLKWNPNWDQREPTSIVMPRQNDSLAEQERYDKEIEKSSAKSARHIILVRHGEYIKNSDGTHNLTELGRLQARYCGKRLSEMGFEFDDIVTSTMLRAQDTAKIIVKEINYDPLKLRSCNFIVEGVPIPPDPPIGHWSSEESYYRHGPRIEAAFRRYFYRASPKQSTDSYILLVGHANVIRYFICRALQFPPEGWLRLTINHCSITWITIGPSGNVIVKYLGDSGYMPAQYVTHSRASSNKMLNLNS